MQRLDYIDQLKGFAILCVVIGHVMLFCVKSTDSLLCYHVITSFHMPLFAFLSGLMFKRQIAFRQTLGKFGKQSVKLLVPFLVVGLLYTYGLLHLGGGKFFSTNAKLGYWYVLFLWQCYLISHVYSFVIESRCHGKSKVAIDLVWMFTVIGLFKVLSLKLGSDAGWIGASWLFRMYPFFFIGTLVKREDLFKRIFDGGRKCFDLMGVAYIVFLVLVMTLFAGRLSLEDAAAPFAIYVIVWLFYQYRQQESIAKKILQNMGRQSLAIYLFHYFLLQSVDYSIFNPSFRAHNPLWLTLVAIFTAFVICQLCICLSWLVRQNRVLSFLCLGMW